MLKGVKRMLDPGSRPGEFCECRHCGTTVERPAAGCPACGSDEIARYEI